MDPEQLDRSLLWLITSLSTALVLTALPYFALPSLGVSDQKPEYHRSTITFLVSGFIFIPFSFPLTFTWVTPLHQGLQARSICRRYR